MQAMSNGAGKVLFHILIPALVAALGKVIGWVIQLATLGFTAFKVSVIILTFFHEEWHKA